MQFKCAKPQRNKRIERQIYMKIKIKQKNQKQKLNKTANNL